MTTYTCTKCGEAGLGMYGHHDSETDGFTCDKKKAEPPSPVAGIEDSDKPIKLLTRGCYDSSDQYFEYYDIEETQKSVREFVARSKNERAVLKKEVEEKRWDVVSWGQKYERVLCELVEAKKEWDVLKKENEALKKIERQRWEGVNKTFGTNYSTEKLNMLARFNPSFGGDQKPEGT